MRNSQPFSVRWLSGIVYLLEYEPTWFPEFGFAAGAVGWGLAGFLTDDMLVHGWGWLLPSVAIILGLLRGFVLMKLWYGCRVMFSVLSATFVAYLWWGLVGRFGIVPQMGWVGGIFLIEMLTAAKFSIPCLRDLLGEAALAGRAP